MESTTYSYAAAPILPSVEIRQIREALADVRERIQAAGEFSEWTQQAVAKRAGIDSSVLNKIEKIEEEMKAIQMKTIVRIVEDGLRLKLSAFFAAIEGADNQGLHLLPKPMNNPPFLKSEAVNGPPVHYIVLTDKQFDQLLRFSRREPPSPTRSRQTSKGRAR